MLARRWPPNGREDGRRSAVEVRSRLARVVAAGYRPRERGPGRRSRRTHGVFDPSEATAARAVFSNTVKEETSLGSWNVRATPAHATSWGDRASSRSPFSNSDPASGRRTPLRILSNVVFPAPFGPTSAVIRPGCNSSDTSRRTSRPPNDLATDRASRTGGNGPPHPLAGAVWLWASASLSRAPGRSGRIPRDRTSRMNSRTAPNTTCWS
jgi:hypothetical protein